MNAAKALEEQIKRYRRMTGEERLVLALELHELSCEVAREGIHGSIPRPRPLKSSACFAVAWNSLALQTCALSYLAP